MTVTERKEAILAKIEEIKADSADKQDALEHLEVNPNG